MTLGPNLRSFSLVIYSIIQLILESTSNFILIAGMSLFCIGMIINIHSGELDEFYLAEIL